MLKRNFVPAHTDHCSEPEFTFLWETSLVRGRRLGEEPMALMAVFPLKETPRCVYEILIDFERTAPPPLYIFLGHSRRVSF